MSSKRTADQVMAMGLAPDRGQTDSPADARAQARLRAESKFTFKPDDHSDGQQLSEVQDIELILGDVNDDDDQ